VVKKTRDPGAGDSQEQDVEAHGPATQPSMRFKVLDPSPETERALSVPLPEIDARATLTVMAGPGAGRVLALTPRDFLLGRGPGADLSFDDHGVSRSHLRVGHDAAGHFIEDLGSTNGTFLGGKRVTHARLASADRFQLGPAVVVRFAMADQLERELLERLVESSTRDPLTGAFNRGFFLERLASEIAYAERHGTKVAALMVDLDHFKAINDGHGHAVGDHVLRAVATAMGRSLRAEDVLGRYGGEEFVILARAATRLDLLRLAERIRASVAAVGVPLAAGTVTVTASIGAARLGELPYVRTPARLLELADSRLYRAKAEGRDRICVAG
jgi:two-component system, cell cycle response regulator